MLNGNLKLNLNFNNLTFWYRKGGYYIMPMERDTIEFNASESGGDWFFHCHILYHMVNGMGRVFGYQDTLVDKIDIADTKVAKRGLNSDDREFTPWEGSVLKAMAATAY